MVHNPGGDEPASWAAEDNPTYTLILQFQKIFWNQPPRQANSDVFLDPGLGKIRVYIYNASDGIFHIWVSPKMDGLFHGKPYEQMDDLGVPLFSETSTYFHHPELVSALWEV